VQRKKRRAGEKYEKSNQTEKEFLKKLNKNIGCKLREEE
jgi:hypothetical protein